jgi:hypothetical protein
MRKPLLVLVAALVATAGAQAAPAPNVPNIPDCARPPGIEVGRALGGRKDAADLVRINFSTAYLRACFKGVLRGRPLVLPNSVPPGRLFLKNAPDSNVASIYQEEKKGRPGRMVLEYHFVVHGGLIMPTADELEEAIFCAVQGVTAAEQEEEGRCLPD